MEYIYRWSPRGVWTSLEERMVQKRGFWKRERKKKKAAIPIKYKAKKKKKSLGNRITGPGPVVNVFPRPIVIFLGQGANWLNRTRLPPKTDSGKTNSVTRRRFPLPDINRSFAANNIFQLIRSLVFFFFFLSNVFNSTISSRNIYGIFLGDQKEGRIIEGG